MDETTGSYFLKKEPRHSVETMPESCQSDEHDEYDRQDAFRCDTQGFPDATASLEKMSEVTRVLNQISFEEEHGRMLAGLNPFIGARNDSFSADLLNQHRVLMQLMRNAQTQPAQRSNLVELQSRADAASVAMRRSCGSRTAFVWSGELPPRNYSHPVFSCKIFVGGVPWDITEEGLVDAFNPYGECRVEWPGREARFSRSRHSPRGKVTGYVYIIFEQEKSVRALLHDCSQEFGSAGEWYFKLKARRFQTTEIRQVQVIPWVVSDATYVEDPSCRLDPKKTVFVGALHGMITAQVLFSIMNELYGSVVFVGIDTDKFKYPIGSGRVTFSSHASYFRAIESAFLEIKTSKFNKKVQIDPFLEETVCMMCDAAPGPYFCRDRLCFRYYCFSCWQARHSLNGPFSDHRSLTRNTSRSNLLPGSEIPEWMHDRPYPSRGSNGQGFSGHMGGPRSFQQDFSSLSAGWAGMPQMNKSVGARRSPWLNTNLTSLHSPRSDLEPSSPLSSGPRSPWGDYPFMSMSKCPPSSPTGSMSYSFPQEMRGPSSVFGFGGGATPTF